MPSTYHNSRKTYEIRIKSTGKVIETTRTWAGGHNLIPKLSKLYGELELIKVK